MIFLFGEVVERHQATTWVDHAHARSDRWADRYRREIHRNGALLGSASPLLSAMASRPGIRASACPCELRLALLRHTLRRNAVPDAVTMRL